MFSEIVLVQSWRMSLQSAINQWGVRTKAPENLYLMSCGIPEVQCSQILQSLSKCKQLTHLTLSGNKVGNAGEYLANTYSTVWNRFFSTNICIWIIVQYQRSIVQQFFSLYIHVPI